MNSADGVETPSAQASSALPLMKVEGLGEPWSQSSVGLLLTPIRDGMNLLQVCQLHLAPC